MKKILLTILCTLLSTMSWAQGTTAGDETSSEAYAVLMSGENNDITATLYYDENRNSHTEGFATVGMDELMQSQAWSMNRENITTVTIDSSFANYRPTSTSFWFAYCRSLTSIVGLQYLRTDETTNMSFMFNECSSLTSLDLSSLNTENVTNISGMLGGCRSLTSVDLSGFNTRQVTNMNSLFEQSAALTTINLSSFNTSQVTDMSYMFNECSALTTIYVGSDWSTEAVTNGTDMFNKCTNLVGGAGTTFSADHIDHTYARIDAEGTPGYLTDSKNASMTHFVMITVEGNGEVSAGQAAVIRDRGDVHVANGEPLEMFFFPDEGYQLTSLMVGSEDVTSQVTPAAEYSAASYTIPGVYGDIAITVTFAQTSTDAEAYAALSEDSLTVTFYYDNQKSVRGGIDINTTSLGSRENSPYGSATTAVFDSSFANYSPTSTSCWFINCFSLTSILDIENLNTANVTDMSRMFSRSSSITNIDLSSFNTENVTDMSRMFKDCTGLVSVNVSSFNTANVTLINGMFDGCSSLTSLDVSGFNTSKVTDMNAMFCQFAGTSLDLSSFNTANVTNMKEMLSGCTNLTTIYVGEGWSTTSVTNSSIMFRGCTNLVGGAGTTYDDNFVDATYAHIDGGTSNPGYFTAKTSGGLEIYAVERNETITPNQPITATASITVTPGDDTEWPTDMSQGSAWVNPLEFVASIYYPNSQETYTFVNSMRGTNDPKDGVMQEGVSSGSSYDYTARNLPQSGGFLVFEALQDGSLIVPVRIFANKPVYVVDSNGKAKTDIQYKDASGATMTLLTEPLCALSTEDGVTGFVSFNVTKGEKYYVFSVGSKARFGGYVFSTEPITIDPATMVDVKDILEGKVDEPYAVLSDNNTVLTFYYDSQKTARGGIDINSGYVSSDPYGNPTTAVFDASFANYTPTSTRSWFMRCSSLTAIIGIENLKTDNVTDMANMFSYCTSLTSLDVSGFNTANVTDMSYMFDNCRSLTSLDVSGFNTANVTNMASLFFECSGLTSIDLSNFNTSNVTSMSAMFVGCSGLTSLDLSGFSTANVTNMGRMFDNCSSLQNIYVGDGWSTAAVTESGSMFFYCIKLVGGAGTAYDENHVDVSYAHIDGGTANPGYFTDKNATPMEKVATPTFSWRNDELTMSCSTEGATIMYQMSDEDTNGDGVINDDDYKQYSAPIEVKRDVIIKAIATKEGMTTSDPITLDYPYEAWTRLYETCIIGQEILSRASRSSRVPDQMRNQAQTYVDYALDMYGRRTADKDEVQGTREEIEIILSEIQQMMQVPASYSNYVLTAEEDATMAEIADQYGSYYGNQVAAIVWNSSVPMTESDLQRFTSNPNLLIYAQSESMVPANRDNVVINGVAKNVVLTDTVSGNCNFYAPQEFTAEAIQYTRTFSQQTQIGVSRGWEAIALPFTVQTYTHADRGVIAPFGNSASENHFWLRELTQNGLQNAQTIEANKPYIISMPNSEEYRPETNLAGEVTFSALNAIVPVTEATPVEYGSISLVPAFQSRSAQTEIYALNVGEERNGYPEGSVFERDYRTVRPFEAYTLHRDNQNPAPQFIMIGGDMGNGTTGIEELVDKRMNTNDSWYTIDGRRLQGAPAGKGLYIRNGKKVIVR